MKSKTKVLLILLVLFIIAFVSEKKASAQHSVLSFQVFYDQLSPYGQWIDYPDYGYVWLPDAGSGFAPYSTNGHWIITEYGFTWVSDYDWGWAPFHYGRWDFEDNIGWFWIPDNEWGPAWVSWRRADGYYGWEPMGPGITLSISFGQQYSSENDHWVFVRDTYIDRSDINYFYVNVDEHDRIGRNSYVINSTYVDTRRNINYASGPAISDVQKATGRRVRLATIVEDNKPGQAFRNGRLSTYRPDVIKNTDNEKRPAPQRFSERQDVKRPVDRNSPDIKRNSNSQNPAREDGQVNVNQRNNNIPDRNLNTKPTRNNRDEVQRNAVNPPFNANTGTNPVQQQNANPIRNSKQDVKQDAVNPTNNNTKTQAVKEQTVRPAKNSRQEKQSVKRQNEQSKKARTEKVKKEND